MTGGTNALSAADRFESLPWFDVPQRVGELLDAYELLPEVASAVCDDSVCGLKAGLTNPDLQQLLGLDEALIGLLYDWGECGQNTVLSARENALMECEIGIRLDEHGMPVSIGPAIEFVHLDFGRPEDFNAPNLVLCGLGADRFLCGDQQAWDRADFDALRNATITLSRNGEVLLKASPHDSLDWP